VQEHCRNLKLTLNISCHVICYVRKTGSKTIRSQVSQPVSAGKGASSSELQAHHCTVA